MLQWLSWLASPKVRLLWPLAAGAGLFSGGCAMVPKQAVVAQVPRQLIVTFQLAAPVNPNYYYFIAIDTAGDPLSGPIPVVSAPWGNGWGTGTITHFVEYHNGDMSVYQMQPASNLLVADRLGPPFMYQVGTNTLQVTLDMDQLGTNLSRINLNIITTERVITDPTFIGTALYDGLGPAGNNFINIPVTASQTFRNGQVGVPETAGDLPPQPSPDATVNSLDITDWTVEVRIASGTTGGG